MTDLLCQSLPTHPRAMNGAPHVAGDLDARQQAFAEAILDTALAPPSGLVGPNGGPSARRFAVYRNNVVVGLVDALKAAFPVVRRLVGEDFFAAMARVYVSREPPATPIMLDYGAGFPQFVGTFEPAAGLVYLADVARLERAWSEAYHAAEAAPLDPAILACLPPELLPGIRLHLHPSVRVVGSPHPVVTIWHSNLDGAEPMPVNLDEGGQEALVCRPEAEVEVRTLPPGAAAFIAALASGAPVIDAAAVALQDDTRFDLAGSLTGLIAARAVTGFVPITGDTHRREP